jgi:hypothetical protein
MNEYITSRLLAHGLIYHIELSMAKSTVPHPFGDWTGQDGDAHTSTTAGLTLAPMMFSPRLFVPGTSSQKVSVSHLYKKGSSDVRLSRESLPPWSRFPGAK